jgi:hypothetical protein
MVLNLGESDLLNEDISALVRFGKGKTSCDQSVGSTLIL